MPWTVYILLCDEKTFYVGITDNLERRLFEHRNKRSFFTKKFSYVDVAHIEKYRTHRDAEKREQQLKKWSAAKKRALIAGDRELLVQLSKSFGSGEGISLK